MLLYGGAQSAGRWVCQPLVLEMVFNEEQVIFGMGTYRAAV